MTGPAIIEEDCRPVMVNIGLGPDARPDQSHPGDAQCRVQASKEPL